MSIVRSLDDLIERAELAAGEAGRYFGDNRIYAERYVERIVESSAFRLS